MSLATFPGAPVGFAGMGLSGKSLLVAQASGASQAIPINGGTPGTLAAVTTAMGAAWFLGADAPGVLWMSAGLPTARGDATLAIAAAPADGTSLQAFWPDFPGQAGLTAIWSDGAGGWIAAGAQTFDDLALHTTIWLLDARGTARLAACDPDATSSIFSPGDAPALTSDAIFFINKDATGWQVVRVPR